LTLGQSGRIAGTTKTWRVGGVALKRGLQEVDAGVGERRLRRRGDGRQRHSRNHGEALSAQWSATARHLRPPRPEGAQRSCRPRHLGSHQTEPPSRCRRRPQAPPATSHAMTDTGCRTATRWLTELKRIWLTRG
jgi:hypothetical protein